MKIEIFVDDGKVYGAVAEPAPAKYDAGALLDKMRPDMETLLNGLAVIYKEEMPTCPSQSYRADRAKALLQKRYLDLRRKLRLAPPGSVTFQNTRNEMLRTMRTIDRLSDFLAVHRTVVLLEGRS